MPIKGLTDRKSSFPEIGQIRKGAEKPTKGVGKDLDHFRLTFDERETAAKAEFEKIYGPEPREINIVFPFNEIDRVWEAWYEAYTAGRMVARTDGEYFEYWAPKGETKVKNGVDQNGNKVPYKEGQSVGKDSKNKDVFCKPSGRLKVVVPELRRLAYLTVLTGSITDIVKISQQLEAIKEINNGQIAGVPLVLKRRPKKISTPSGSNGSRVRRTKWMLSVEADPEWVKRKISEIKHLALPGNGLEEYEKAMLPESVEVETETDFDEIEGEIVEDEPIEESTPEPSALIKAQNTQTPKGARLGDLVAPQLQAVIDSCANFEKHAALKEAAEIVLEDLMQPEPEQAKLEI